jgi:hypothetical protein
MGLVRCNGYGLSYTTCWSLCAPRKCLSAAELFSQSLPPHGGWSGPATRCRAGRTGEQAIGARKSLAAKFGLHLSRLGPARGRLGRPAGGGSPPWPSRARALAVPRSTAQDPSPGPGPDGLGPARPRSPAAQAVPCGPGRVPCTVRAGPCTVYRAGWPGRRAPHVRSRQAVMARIMAAAPIDSDSDSSVRHRHVRGAGRGLVPRRAPPAMTPLPASESLSAAPQRLRAARQRFGAGAVPSAGRPAYCAPTARALLGLGS